MCHLKCRQNVCPLFSAWRRVNCPRSYPCSAHQKKMHAQFLSEAVRPSTTWRTGALARMSRFLPFCCCWLPPPPTVRVITAVQRIFISCLLCVSHWASLIFNPENKPSWLVLFSSFHRWENWDSERIRGDRNIPTCTSFYNISCYLTLHFPLILEPA